MKTNILWSLVITSLLLPSVPGQPPFYPDKSKLLVYRDEQGREQLITTVADWARRRAHILANMELAMGPLPDAKTKVPLEVKYLDEVKTPHFVRKKLTFAVAAGERVPAYLLWPLERQGKVPAVLCLHQTNGALGGKEPAGLGKSENLRYAAHLAERGYVTLAPDYPSFGDYPYDFSKSPFQSGSMKAIWNNMCAIDLLQALPEVDPERIGCIGHSLGGLVCCRDSFGYSLEGIGSSNSKFANDLFVSSGVSKRTVLISLCTSSDRAPRYCQASWLR